MTEEESIKWREDTHNWLKLINFLEEKNGAFISTKNLTFTPKNEYKKFTSNELKLEYINWLEGTIERTGYSNSRGIIIPFFQMDKDEYEKYKNVGNILTYDKETKSGLIEIDCEKIQGVFAYSDDDLFCEFLILNIDNKYEFILDIKNKCLYPYNQKNIELRFKVKDTIINNELRFVKEIPPKISYSMPSKMDKDDPIKRREIVIIDNVLWLDKLWTKSGHMIGSIYSNLESKNKSEKYSCILSNTFNVETYEVSITVLSSADIPNMSKYTLGDLKNLTSIENK